MPAWLHVLGVARRLIARWFDHVLDDRGVVLIEDGKIEESVMRSLRISDQELGMALHDSGLESVSQVKTAVVEPDGSITIIKA
jgi:uncharacterized membrane protein YcaP (DUF421 family)